MFFASSVGRVTSVSFQAASRLCEVMRAGPPEAAPPSAERPGWGASRPGRWRFLGGLVGVETRLMTPLLDHADLGDVPGAAIDHLFAHERRTGIALGAGGDVLARQRGQGSDGAERDDEEAEGRLQHILAPFRRWCCVVDLGCRGAVFPGDVVKCFICFVAGYFRLRDQPRFSARPPLK